MWIQCFRYKRISYYFKSKGVSGRIRTCFRVIRNLYLKFPSTIFPLAIPGGTEILGEGRPCGHFCYTVPPFGSTYLYPPVERGMLYLICEHLNFIIQNANADDQDSTYPPIFSCRTNGIASGLRTSP